MSFFKTEHEKKATIKTAFIMILLLISFFLVGLTYLDPPEEMGIEINFGTSDDGRGEVQPFTNKTPKNIPQQTESQPSKSPVKDAALTQDEEDAPVVSKAKNKPKKDKPVTNKPQKPEKPKPDKSTSDALNNILGAPGVNNQPSSGQGDGQGNGDQGQIDGNPYANAFYGGGSGSGSGYGLNGRKRESYNKKKPNCNETGRVVVRIEVNQSGKVVKATPGVKGTTNTDPCLMEPARKTALSYRFNADNKAPKTQIGFVIVNFSLE